MVLHSEAFCSLTLVAILFVLSQDAHACFMPLSTLETGSNFEKDFCLAGNSTYRKGLAGGSSCKGRCDGADTL